MHKSLPVFGWKKDRYLNAKNFFILFKVLAIVFYILRPSFMQFLKTVPKKLSVFCSKPFIKPFFNFLEIAEVLLCKRVPNWCKQMLVIWHQVWGVQRVRMDLPSKWFESVFYWVCCKRRRIFVQQNDPAMSCDPLRPFPSLLNDCWSFLATYSTLLLIAVEFEVGHLPKTLAIARLWTCVVSLSTHCPSHRNLHF